MTNPSAIDTSQWRTLRFEQRTRYYRLHLEQDLWGTWCLIRVNGRCGSALGRAVTTWSGALADAETVLRTAAERRRRRGYHATACP
jgi:hypothetical protein